MFGGELGMDLEDGGFDITVEVIFGAGDEVMDAERTGRHRS